jgi:hypothetical protein
MTTQPGAPACGAVLSARTGLAPTRPRLVNAGQRRYNPQGGPRRNHHHDTRLSMQHDENPAPQERTGVATHVVQAVTALVLLVIGIVVVVESRRLGSGWTSDGPAAGYFPFLIGLILLLSSAGMLVEAWTSAMRKREVFVDREQFRRVLSVLLPAVLYVAAVQFLGLYVASAAYIALFMVLLGKYSWLKSVIAGVAVNAVLFCMFEVWFKVPLFKGSLEPLAFLGY